MDPYAALRFREFNIFLLVRFAMVFAWSMQFIVIEWQVYSMTKDPLSLGIIGLMEVIPAVSTALFAGHVVDQKEKRNLLIKCIFVFSIISLGLFILSWPSIELHLSQQVILYGIYEVDACGFSAQKAKEFGFLRCGFFSLRTVLTTSCKKKA